LTLVRRNEIIGLKERAVRPKRRIAMEIHPQMDPAVALSEFFSLEGKTALLAPAGEFSLEQAVDMIRSAIVFCRENEIPGLLIDARQLYGFPHPSVSDRYWFVHEWKDAAEGKVVLSFIQRPEMIDPGQIGVTMAANAGLEAAVFDNEPAARQWLRIST
jgi:hypothetical protein